MSTEWEVGIAVLGLADPPTSGNQASCPPRRCPPRLWFHFEPDKEASRLSAYLEEAKPPPAVPTLPTGWLAGVLAGAKGGSKGQVGQLSLSPGRMSALQPQGVVAK